MRCRLLGASFAERRFCVAGDVAADATGVAATVAAIAGHPVGWWVVGEERKRPVDSAPLAYRKTSDETSKER